MHKRLRVVLFLTTSLLLISMIPTVYASPEDVIDLSTFPTQLANAFNISVFAGELLASAFLLCLFGFPTLLLTHGKTRQELPFTFVGILVLSVCVAVGWCPYFILLLIVFTIAFSYADKIRTIFMGGK